MHVFSLINFLEIFDRATIADSVSTNVENGESALKKNNNKKNGQTGTSEGFV